MDHKAKNYEQRGFFGSGFLNLFVALGAVLVLAPNILLAIFGVAPTNEVWLRVAGMLLILIAYYYFQASGAEMTQFFRWSAQGRLAVPVFFIAFVLLGYAPPILILFGVIDAAAAFWTLTALRQDSGA